MAKKINAAEIKKLLKAGNMIIGTKKSLESLKLGKVEKVFVSSNCPEAVEKSIGHYADLSKAEVHKLDYPNDELSVICRKPFSISVLSLLKGAGK